MSFSSLRPSPITYSMALRRFGSSDRAGVALSRGRMAENEEEEWQGCEEITESLIPRRLVMLKFSSRLILSTISTSLSTWSPSSTCLSSRRLVSSPTCFRALPRLQPSGQQTTTREALTGKMGVLDKIAEIERESSQADTTRVPPASAVGGLD